MINTAYPLTAQRTQSAVSETAQLSVRFWGVRGSVPTPVATHQRYGGNTVCVELLLGDQRIIFDGGTGLVDLGHYLQRQSLPSHGHILFTHTQWDRIQGFPFFQPAFVPGNQFSVYGGTAPNGASIKHCLTDQMLQPHFSMPLQHMRADLSFDTLSGGASFQIDDIQVDVMRTNALTEALGYRLTWQEYTVVYATDTSPDAIDPEFLQFVDQADILIYDGTYRDLTYLHTADSPEMRQPWELGVEISQQANVKELALLHHSPIQDDATLDQLQQEVSDRFTNAKVAYEGLILQR